MTRHGRPLIRVQFMIGRLAQALRQSGPGTLSDNVGLDLIRFQRGHCLVMGEEHTPAELLQKM